MKNNISKFSLVIILLSIVKVSKSQDIEHKYQARTSFTSSIQPVKQLKLDLTPEFRFDEKLKLDEYIYEGILKYKPAKVVQLIASYRFIGTAGENAAYYGRYAAGIKTGKDFDRFKPALRILYSNYADDEITNKKYLRYKASLQYDVPNIKLTPFIAAEAFHQLDNKRIHKMRYQGGFDYKLCKNNYIGLSYKFDYYRFLYRNRHIVSISYKINF